MVTERAMVAPLRVDPVTGEDLHGRQVVAALQTAAAIGELLDTGSTQALRLDPELVNRFLFGHSGTLLQLAGNVIYQVDKPQHIPDPDLHASRCLPIQGFLSLEAPDPEQARERVPTRLTVTRRPLLATLRSRRLGQFVPIEAQATLYNPDMRYS